MHDAAVELNIDTGDKRRNKRLFDALLSRKAEIEAALGAPLEWQRLDDARRSKIRYKVRKGGLTTPEAKWPAIQAAMVAAMEQLVEAFQPHLRDRPGAPTKPQPLQEPTREVQFGSYTVRELATGSIEVERNGKPVTPTKPALRELASKLNIGLRNRNGNPLNTRQLGRLVVACLEQRGGQ